MRETTAAQCPIHPMETQPCPACLDALDNSMASYNAGYAAGYRAAKAEQTSGKAVFGSVPGHTEGQKMPGPLDHQSAAGTNCATEDGARPSPESARGPAADPIADLCARLRDKTFLPEFWRQLEAADALERLAAENGPLHDTLAAERFRAQRAEAERDSMRAVVRAADGLRAECDQVPPMVQQRNVLHAYDAARAKVKP